LYTASDDRTPLADHHRRQLEESGISNDIASERGYATAGRRAELPAAFKNYQRRAPALVIPTYSPDKETTSHQIKPDNPRRDKRDKPVKYETAGGSRIIIDVHPRMMDRVRDGSEPFFITEGIKSADSLASLDAPTIALVGVWMAQKDKKLLPCWDHVPLHGRVVYIVFDADVMTKEGVQLALERLVRLLEERGADVRVVYLTDGDVDDHVVAGGTRKELKMMARRFDPEDVGRFRLVRYPDLRVRIEALRRIWWEKPYKGKGGYTRRDITKALTSAACRHGEVVDDGVRVSLSSRTLEIRASASRPTILKQLKKLEEEGDIRIEKAQKAEHAASYVLLVDDAQLDHQSSKEGEGKPSYFPSHPGGKAVRSPRLRWSYPGCKEHRRFVKRTSRPRATKVCAKEKIERLGKIRGAVIDVLDRDGGSATVREICQALHRPRLYELRKRVLPMLEEAGITTAGPDDRVTLTPDWLEALELERERGEEVAGERRKRAKHRREREAYRHYRTHPPDEGPTDEDLEALRESAATAIQERQRRKFERMRDKALEAFRAFSSGARKNLELAEDGEMANVEALVKSVLAYHAVPIVRWDRVWELWRKPVLEAAFIAREHAPPAPLPPPEPEPPPEDYRDHALSCECEACLYPEPRYARPYRGSA